MPRTPPVAAMIGVAFLTQWAASAADTEGPLKVVEGAARVGKIDRPAAHFTLQMA
jgi:hypothetical protein